MKTTARLFFAALLSALLIPVSQSVIANGGNHLKDPGFELELSSEKGGWILFDESRFSRDHARSGSGAMFNWGFSRTVASPPFLLGTASGSYQDFPVEPGSRWRMSGYAMAPNAIKGALAFGIVQISFFDSDGNDLGTVETAGNKARARTSNQVNNKTPAGEWVFLDTGVATAPANTAKIHAFTLFVDYSGSEISQGVYLDDINLCTVDGDGSDCE